jgi:hypothetical protein
LGIAKASLAPTLRGEHAFSKVAGHVDLSIDLRTASQALLARAPELIGVIATDVARQHGVGIDLGTLTEWFMTGVTLRRAPAVVDARPPPPASSMPAVLGGP